MANTPITSSIESSLEQLPINSSPATQSQAQQLFVANSFGSKSKRIKDRTITNFFRKKTRVLDEEQGEQNQSQPNNPNVQEDENNEDVNSIPDREPIQSNMVRLTEFDILSLPQDPGMRKRIAQYHPSNREIVQREYLRRGPCQSEKYNFPQTVMGKVKRRFKPEWFKNFESWLEYSKEKDVAFCFACYLFKKDNMRGSDAFVSNGFNTWSRPGAFDTHVGNHMSTHNNCMRDLDNFRKQEESIIARFDNHSAATKNAYHTRLEASIKTARFLLKQGLAFRGHNEKDTSLNRGNFNELLKLIAQHDENIAKVVLDKAPGNCILTSAKIQKQIVSACALETIAKIVEELDGGFFCILADESADISDKEQMTLCLRYVGKKGEVKERFFGVVHVGDTTSLTLKKAISELLMKYSLTFSNVRGQGYDDASNMQGSINGLKTLILHESSSAYSVHCFAHQLQLILVAIAKKNHDCSWLFETLTNLLNLVGSSPKRKEILRERQAEQVLKELYLGEIESGSGLNQELGLGRPGDTRWHSHFKTILNVIALYSSILNVIDTIGEFSTGVDNVKAESLSYALRKFDFIFVAQLMLTIFGVTNELNIALQKKEQDIVNAMSLVDVTKGSLQRIRDNGWDSHIDKVTTFCLKHNIEVYNMDDLYVIPGRHRRGCREVTNLHHFRVEVFISFIDQILQEFDNRFNEVSKELLICMSSFNPQNQFASFDSKKLLRLAEFYPREFSSKDLLIFEYQLDTFKYDVQSDDRFSGLRNLNELYMKLVETMKHLTHSKVYLLLKLALILPMATASVERAFSAMSFIKNRLRNSMGDDLLNDNLVTYLERDVFVSLTDDEIVNQFLNMKTRRIS